MKHLKGAVDLMLVLVFLTFNGFMAAAPILLWVDEEDKAQAEVEQTVSNMFMYPCINTNDCYDE